MNFVTIRPAERQIALAIAREPHEIQPELGLDQVDHGLVRRARGGQVGIGIIVAEFGMFLAPEKQSYFAIGDTLFAGNALAYGFDEGGMTVDLPFDDIKPHWFTDAQAVETAMQDGWLRRPKIAVDGKVQWQWPEPQPAMFHE